MKVFIVQLDDYGPTDSSGSRVDGPWDVSGVDEPVFMVEGVTGVTYWSKESPWAPADVVGGAPRCHLRLTVGPTPPSRLSPTGG